MVKTDWYSYLPVMQNYGKLFTNPLNIGCFVAMYGYIKMVLTQLEPPSTQYPKIYTDIGLCNLGLIFH